MTQGSARPFPPRLEPELLDEDEHRLKPLAGVWRAQFEAAIHALKSKPLKSKRSLAARIGDALEPRYAVQLVGHRGLHHGQFGLVGELTRTDVRRIGYSLSLPKEFVETLAQVPWKEAPPDLAAVDLSRATGFHSTELPETFTGTREMPEILPESETLPSEEDLPPSE